jgi:hypothetical protein
VRDWRLENIAWSDVARNPRKGVRRKETPNSRAFLITNLICPESLEEPLSVLVTIFGSV